MLSSAHSFGHDWLRFVKRSITSATVEPGSVTVKAFTCYALGSQLSCWTRFQSFDPPPVRGSIESLQGQKAGCGSNLCRSSQRDGVDLDQKLSAPCIPIGGHHRVYSNPDEMLPNRSWHSTPSCSLPPPNSITHSSELSTRGKHHTQSFPRALLQATMATTTAVAVYCGSSLGRQKAYQCAAVCMSTRLPSAV